MKKRIFDIIQIGNKEDFPSRAFDLFIVITIILNILTMFLQTFSELEPLSVLFKWVEGVTLGIFCIEYFLRIWTADYLYPNMKGIMAKVKFLFSFEGIVDLLTILPFFYLSGFIAFRMVRIVRIFHLFRINGQTDSFHVITEVLYEKKNQIVSSLFIIIILMLASSIGMYSAEHEAQPEAFANAFSGIWWSAAALLTIGYGDIYPITVMGRIMAIISAFLGVGVVAIPTGIISAGFVEQYSKQKYADYSLSDVESIGEVLVTKGHLYEGLYINELWDKYSVRVMVILRGQLTLLATPTVQVEEGDILVLQSDRLQKKSSVREEDKKVTKGHKKK